MVMNDKSGKEKIEAFTPRDWQPLFALIPEIEGTSTFGEWKGGGKDQEGVIQFPYCNSEPIVSRFLEVVYDLPVIIDFNWGAWDEGRKMTDDEGFDFDSVDLFTKCKLITAIVRSDRFCEGALVSAFKSGLILKILKSMEREVHGRRH